MRAGIIAEGKSDSAVITNILKGLLKIDRSDVQYLLPELEYDETDLSRMRLEQFSNWTLVKRHCEEGTLINRFFQNIDDERFLVIHIDTAERCEPGFDTPEPQKSDDPAYITQVRENVVMRLRQWIGNNSNERISFAVAVEETEAWIIPIFDNPTLETGYYVNAKERLKRLLNRPNRMTLKERRVFHLDEFEKFLKLSESFRKSRNLERFADQSQSLKLFCEDLSRFSI